MFRYDTPTKHGSLGVEVKITSTNRVDNYQTLNFIVTIHPPHGFKDRDIRTHFKRNKIVITALTEREITPDDYLTF